MPEQRAQGGHDRLQGQVPIEHQESGRSLRPYKHNMRLVGKINPKNRGMNGNLAWIEDCAYVAAYYGTDKAPQSDLAGMAIVNASNPRNPQLVEIKPGTAGSRESQVEANAKGRILINMPWEYGSPYGDPEGPNLLKIYKVAPDDCTDVTRVGTYNFGDHVPHEFRISEDGDTVYVAGYGESILVIDVSDPSNPELLTSWDLSDVPGMPNSSVHDLDVNAEGTRAYLNIGFEDQNGVDHEGLAIVDTTEVEERRPNPTIELISQTY